MILLNTPQPQVAAPFMRRFLSICLILFFAAIVCAEDGKNLDDEIRQLVRKLGDESFVVRERAEAQLLRIGIDAYPELQKARNDPDVEIARRADRVLARFELLFIGREHESVRYWITQYAFTPGRAEKGAIIWLFCNPLADFRHGEGLRTLCRIARFDEDHALRAEAVKGLIASPPLSPARQRKWYRSLRESFAQPGEDELLVLLYTYVNLRCELEDLKEATEELAREEEKRTKIHAVYPVTLPVDETLRQRVRQLTDLIAAFQAKPENNGVRVGNRNDILLFYALAELQQLAGLEEELARTVAAAGSIRSENFETENMIEPDEQRAFFEHFMAARALRFRYHILWEMQHAKLVLEHGHILLKVEALRMLADAHQLRREFPEAIGYFDQAIELVQSEEFIGLRNDSEDQVKTFRAGRSLNLAQVAAEAGDWQKVREHVEQGLKDDPYELDILILAWQMVRKLSLNEKERQDLDRKIDAAIRHSEREMHQQPNAEYRQIHAVSACNHVAWILANTEGDYASASKLIETAIKAEPEDVAFLDTMAHVYRLGKEYDKAVETQERVVCLAPEAVIFHDALARFRKDRDENRPE